MKWHIVTCDKTRHIIPAQQYLFSKYVPEADIEYIDVANKDTEGWTHHVLEGLKTTDEHIVFGLDDFLPIDHYTLVDIPHYRFDRIELGWGGSRKGAPLADGFNLYRQDELYRVSCQFSIWRTEALIELLQTKRSPWKFETKGELNGNVLSVSDNPFRYIEESALSNRQPGKVNLCGLRVNDIFELFRMGHVKEDDIVYGWAGNEYRTRESYGKKYAEYY